MTPEDFGFDKEAWIGPALNMLGRGITAGARGVGYLGRQGVNLAQQGIATAKPVAQAAVANAKPVVQAASRATGQKLRNWTGDLTSATERPIAGAARMWAGIPANQTFLGASRTGTAVNPITRVGRTALNTARATLPIPRFSDSQIPGLHRALVNGVPNTARPFDQVRQGLGMGVRWAPTAAAVAASGTYGYNQAKQYADAAAEALQPVYGRTPHTSEVLWDAANIGGRLLGQQAGILPRSASGSVLSNYTQRAAQNIGQQAAQWLHPSQKGVVDDATRLRTALSSASPQGAFMTQVVPQFLPPTASDTRSHVQDFGKAVRDTALESLLRPEMVKEDPVAQYMIQRAQQVNPLMRRLNSVFQ